ncbi:MAG TPA: tetratricopeptide repeat protein [Chitinophagaceae bacterium]|nr:tetratricopeptide repeat protein [Chitinophagaceae bacterium]
MQVRSLIMTLLLITSCYGLGWSQSDASQLYSTAQGFMRSGDYANAILVLNRAVQLAPENAEYRKQLAFSYYLNNNLKQADKIIKQVLNSDAADVQTYQIAGNIYKSENDPKAAERNYKRGLKKFPNSGDLYNELGQIYSDQREYTDALRYWTTGIKVDPGFASNYYNAARTYYYSTDKVWAVIYGEIFINLERFTTRTAEMKNILLASYKELFNNSNALHPQLPALNGDKNSAAAKPDFKQSFLNALSKGSGTIITRGITPQTLVMLRTRFVLDWSDFYKFIYPYSLFAYQQTLLKQGLFEAYNEWVFGPAANLPLYKAWVKQHEDEMHRLIKYLNTHSLKPKDGQFYQTGKITFEPSTLPQS